MDSSCTCGHPMTEHGDGAWDGCQHHYTRSNGLEYAGMCGCNRRTARAQVAYEQAMQQYRASVSTARGYVTVKL